MAKFQDGWLHAVGYCVINETPVIKPESEEVRLNIGFMSAELTITVPRSLIFKEGVTQFHEEDMAYVDMRLGVESSVKSFQGNTYAKTNISVKKVLEFRKLTQEEQKAL